MQKPTLHHLKNGIPVLLAPQKTAESMTLLVLFRVGSRYETKDINGASHFIEHLMFKGTEKRPKSEQITQELDRYGAEFNAYTDKDVTGYYVKMDASKTNLAIDLLHDMLFHSRFDKKEIDRERGVIVEEINMYEDNPRMHIDDLLEEIAFPNSTLGWNIAGPREVIRRVTREELMRYHEAYYIPERMTIALTGKVVNGALKMLEQKFGSVRRVAGKDRPYEPFQKPEALKKRIAFQDRQTEQVQYALSFHGLKMNDPALPTVNLLATILGGSMSSRLFVEIRERRGLCYSISASHQVREDTGAFLISSGLEKTRVAEASKAIIQELKKISKTLVTSEELRRAKDHLRGRMMLAFEDSATQAEWYGRQWLFQGKMETPEDRLKKIEKVTAAQIRALAKQLFKPEHMAAAVIGPFGKQAHVEKIIRW
jgi:predicted Zn-dependent peptidase